jgi:hypothetical protein
LRVAVNVGVGVACSNHIEVTPPPPHILIILHVDLAHYCITAPYNRSLVMYNCPTALTGVGVGVLAADSQSTSKSGYRASLWDP